MTSFLQQHFNRFMNNPPERIHVEDIVLSTSAGNEDQRAVMYGIANDLDNDIVQKLLDEWRENGNAD